MTWPMMLLAVGSVGSGAAFAIGGTLNHWLEPVVGTHEIHHVAPVWVVTTVILSVVAVGVGVAYRMYGTRPVTEEVPAGSSLTVAARKDLYGDALNERVLMRPGQLLTKGLVEIDDRAVDQTVNGIGSLTDAAARRIRLVQNGFTRSYALTMFSGAALVVAAAIVVVRR